MSRAKYDFNGYVWNQTDYNTPFYIMGIYEKHYEKRPAALTCRNKTLQWVLSYPYNENILYKIGTDKKPWKKREANVLYLYPPGSIIIENYEKAAFPRKSINLSFYANNCRQLAKLVHGHSYACFSEEKGNTLISLLLNILSVVYNEKDRAFWKANANLCSIIDILVNSSRNIKDEYYVINTKRENPKYSKSVQLAIDYIYRHSHEALYLCDIANYANMSISSLSHKYLQETGETPLQSHMRLKIELVKEMISSGEPLKVIASRLGFSDMFYLSKIFKKMTGVTVDKFKKMSKL